MLQKIPKPLVILMSSKAAMGSTECSKKKSRGQQVQSHVCQVFFYVKVELWLYYHSCNLDIFEHSLKIPLQDCKHGPLLGDGPFLSATQLAIASRVDCMSQGASIKKYLCLS